MRSSMLLLLLPLVSGNCVLPTEGDTVDWDESDVCDEDSFNRTLEPPIRNLTDSSGHIKHDCGILFMLDLDNRFVSTQDFKALKIFLKETVSTCLQRGVGRDIIINNLFNRSGVASKATICCDSVPCDPAIDGMSYDYYVGHYDSTAPIQEPGPEGSDTDFTIAILSSMKELSKESTRCLYNTVVLITNRIFNTSQEVVDDIDQVVTYGCETFTVIAVGNPQINSSTLFKYYGTLTQYQFVVQDFNCLPDLATCVKSCGQRAAKECQNFQDDGNCPLITTPAPSTTTTTVTTTTTTENPKYDNYWHLIYLFALSNRTTPAEFQRAVNYVQIPIQDCINQKTNLLVRFLAKNNSDSGWLSDINAIHKHLEELSLDEVLLDASPAIDVNDTTTLELVQRAVSLQVPTGGKNEPRLTLLTDFVSETFIIAYNTSTTLIREMETFDFQIYCFDQEAADIYKSQIVTKTNHIHADPDFSDSQSSLVPLCSHKKPPVPVIMLIIIGTCVGVMVVLILVTILYRQKYMWSEKLNRFKSSQTRNGEETADVIDYWELSWDKLIVKNERLGHGAYGQVFKGKLIGPSPGIEHFHRSEIAMYSDCDCAVKMLPRYATENARTEFMHEIQLMKTLGLHDNIVNMLGCITAGKSCLVLEYCSNRDLLRYLKQKKAELEISKSMDYQIDLTKELMHLAWQIANGMRFLGEKNIIHRDLAARNILISGLDGLKNAKIGDFGLAMSASPDEHALSASGRLPIKWLALESLQKEQFSFKSDVWSFGIVLFEMYSMGEIPFADVEPTDLIAHLVAGNRPKPPLITPEKIAEMMMSCWHKNPEERPTFDEMLGILMTLLEQATEGYGYLALLKTSENYRVVSEINDDYQHPMDSYYADGPCLQQQSDSTISSGHSRRMSNASRIQINVDIVRQPSRKRAITLQRTVSDSSSDEGGSRDRVQSARGNDESNEEGWAARVRRRRSQLANLNPFRKIRDLARSASKPRRGSL